MEFLSNGGDRFLDIALKKKHKQKIDKKQPQLYVDVEVFALPNFRRNSEGAVSHVTSSSVSYSQETMLPRYTH